MVQKKSWKEFRESGLLLYINQILHVFGWAIVVELKDNEIVDIYPARVKFRGFDNESVSNSYKSITSYLKNNIDELEKEV